MKSDIKPVIGFICVMLICILVIGITFGLLRSASKFTVGATAGEAGNTTDINTDNPPAEEQQPEPEPELIWGLR